MYSFACDYSEGAHERILSVMAESNRIQMGGYGGDTYTANAVNLIKERFQRDDAGVYLLVTGTQTNLIACAAMLRAHEAVITAETGHINANEAGAIESTGHKVITVATNDGRLRPHDIEHVLALHFGAHLVKPKVVYITNSAETGTIYTKAELTALSGFCKVNNLLLYMDGARLGSALTSEYNDLTMPDFARYCDAFYFSAAKNGGLIGEALVICHPAINVDFNYIMKQRGGTLGKSRTLGIQFVELLKDDLYFELARHANQLAKKIADGLSASGIDLVWKRETNQVFPIFNNTKIEQLKEEFSFIVWKPISEDTSAIRLITSWATIEDEVDRFIAIATK